MCKLEWKVVSSIFVVLDKRGGTATAETQCFASLNIQLRIKREE